MGFAGLVDNLVSVGLFDKSDGKRAIELYKNIRIPLVHGLPRRFVRQHQGWFDEFWDLTGEAVSAYDFEEIVEDHAVKYLDNIVDIIERNRF